MIENDRSPELESAPAPASVAPIPASSKRYVLLGFLMVLSIITYLDRTTLSVAAVRIQNGLSLSEREWGWVTGLFTLFYGVWAIPLGALGDRLGQRKVLSVIVVGWSAFTAMTGMAVNYVMLLLSACLFGSGEAGAYPNISSCISRWFPAGERARAQGGVWAASRVGGAVAPLLVIPIIEHWSWRAPFVIFGGLGLAWAGAWFAWYRNHPSQIAQKLANSEVQLAAASAKPVPWGRLCRARQLWLIMAMYWCYVWGSVFFISWMHKYMIKGRGFSELQMESYSAFPFLMGMAGNIIGGFLGDKMVKKLGVSLGRRIMGTTCLIATVCIFAALAMTKSKTSAFLLLCLGFGIMDCMLPSAWALCLDVGREYAGAVSGAMNTAGSAGGFTCSVVFGYIVQQTGSYSSPLLVIAIMVTISAILFWFIDPSKPLLPSEGEA